MNWVDFVLGVLPYMLVALLIYAVFDISYKTRPRK